MDLAFTPAEQKFADEVRASRDLFEHTGASRRSDGRAPFVESYAPGPAG